MHSLVVETAGQARSDEIAVRKVHRRLNLQHGPFLVEDTSARVRYRPRHVVVDVAELKDEHQVQGPGAVDQDVEPPDAVAVHAQDEVRDEHPLNQRREHAGDAPGALAGAGAIHGHVGDATDKEEGVELAQAATENELRVEEGPVDVLELVIPVPWLGAVDAKGTWGGKGDVWVHIDDIGECVVANHWFDGRKQWF